MAQNNNIPIATLPLSINVLVSVQKDIPCIWLRKQFTHKDDIKKLILCAIYNTPIVIIPTYNNPLKFICNLKDKGLIYEDKDTKEIKFTF